MFEPKPCNRTQEDIMREWGDFDTPLVSIKCLTYNHKPYISHCLDGFLNQITSFPFEIVVHDDASTDNTADIIRQYQSKYPLIIKPIYEKENQYSKKDGALDKTVNAQLRGEFIAVCEGDDYWCNPEKLQKAIDFLREHTDYSACTHNTYFANTSKFKKNFIRYPKQDCDVSLRDALNHNSYHTSSIVCRKEYWFSKPKFCFMQPGVGDYPLSVYLTMVGKVRRLGYVMSVYRCGVPGSWQKRVACNYDLYQKNVQNAIAMLTEANRWSEESFKEDFLFAIRKLEYKILIIKGRFKEVQSELYNNYWESESFTNKIKIFFKYYSNKIKSFFH